MSIPTNQVREVCRRLFFVTCATLLGFVCACDSDQSVNVGNSAGRLSHASNNISDSGAWSLDESDMDDRWSEDPTIMEPDYPFMGPHPGFGSSELPQDD